MNINNYSSVHPGNSLCTHLSLIPSLSHSQLSLFMVRKLGTGNGTGNETVHTNQDLVYVILNLLSIANSQKCGN